MSRSKHIRDAILGRIPTTTGQADTDHDLDVYRDAIREEYSNDFYESLAVIEAQADTMTPECRLLLAWIRDRVPE